MSNKLKKAYTVNFREYGLITVPKGTKTTNQTAMGLDLDYNFVNEFEWVEPHDNGIKQYGLLMDLKNYGLNVPKEYLEEI